MTDYLLEAKGQYDTAKRLADNSDYTLRHGFDEITALLRFADVALRLHAAEPAPHNLGRAVAGLALCEARDPERAHQLCVRFASHTGRHDDGSGREW